MEARTCTANEISARIPHPSLRDTFPPGEGTPIGASGHLGCGGESEIWADVGIGPYVSEEERTCTANRLWADVPQSAPTAWVGVRG